MVTFSCEVCNESLAKKKLMGHFGRCPNAFFTCIDCSTTFEGNDFQQHTQCISEAEKYEKALYKPKGKPQSKPQGQLKQPEAPKPEPKTAASKQPKTAQGKDQKPPKTKSQKAPDSYINAITAEGLSLYELFKIAKKSGKNTDKKKLLKQLRVFKDSDGKLVLQPSTAE